MTLPLHDHADARELIKRATTFLFSIKSINVEKLRPEAVMPELAEAVLKERGLKAPIGKVTAMDDASGRSESMQLRPRSGGRRLARDSPIVPSGEAG